MKRAFTLIELLVVVAIMGLLGTVSIGGYRAMQRGMEERGVMQNVNEFMKAAYQRAQIDRAPVAVYFWNETLREETDTETLIVVGKAVAVRRAGRISGVTGSYLRDEFGDLRYSRLTLDEDEDEDREGGTSEDGIYLYQINGAADGAERKRSIISQSTQAKPVSQELALGQGSVEIDAYAYELLDRNGVTWAVGDGYGFEFAEIQLPKNFIFGTSYRTDTASPVQEVQKSLFTPGQVSAGSGATAGSGSSGRTIQVCSLRPNASGEIAAQPVDTSDDPSR